MKWSLVFLVSLSLATACIVEDQPINGGTGGTGGTGGGAGGSGGAGGMSDPCGGCSGETPVCDEETLQCVQCIANGDCNATAPVCIESECVCTMDSDCTSRELARCDTEEARCAPCTNDDQCEGVAGLPTGANACEGGNCFDCTPETEATTCTNMFSCNPRTNTCTTTRVGSLGVCEECVADSECVQGASSEYRCVPMFFPGRPDRFPDANHGFCLKTTEGGCEQPYAIRLDDRASLSNSPDDDYCGIEEELTTCPAVVDLLGNRSCNSGEDAQCFQPGGLCRRLGGVLDNRCTYPCGLAAQCPADAPANTCGPGDTELQDYCGG